MTARVGRKTHSSQEFNAHQVRHEILTPDLTALNLTNFFKQGPEANTDYPLQATRPGVTIGRKGGFQWRGIKYNFEKEPRYDDEDDDDDGGGGGDGATARTNFKTTSAARPL